MTLNKSNLLLALLLIFVSFNTIAQNIDSLLNQRTRKFQEYLQYKENIGERTWIKLLNLSNLAYEIIELDNQLVDYYSNGIGRNTAYKEKTEELNLEISLLKREAEIQQTILEDRKFLNDTMLKIIGGAILLLIGLLIFSIDRNIRYRNTRMELERAWAGEINASKESTSEQEIVKVNEKIRSLSIENTRLKDQVLELKNKIKDKEKILDEELNSRKQLKEEIRNLIAQIKSQ